MTSESKKTATPANLKVYPFEVMLQTAAMPQFVAKVLKVENIGFLVRFEKENYLKLVSIATLVFCSPVWTKKSSLKLK